MLYALLTTLVFLKLRNDSTKQMCLILTRYSSHEKKFLIIIGKFRKPSLLWYNYMIFGNNPKITIAERLKPIPIQFFRDNFSL